MSEAMKLGQLAVIVILAAVAAWFVVRTYSTNLSRPIIIARLFALILVVVGVGIRTRAGGNGPVACSRLDRRSTLGTRGTIEPVGGQGYVDRAERLDRRATRSRHSRRYAVHDESRPLSQASSSGQTRSAGTAIL